MNKIAYIKQLLNGKYRVFLKSGRNMGTFSTKEKAKKRLSQIEMFKHLKNRKAEFKKIINIIKNSKQTEVTNTYSSKMRELNKKNPEKVKSFMIAFKNTFDAGLKNKIDDLENTALLEAIQKYDS